MAMLLIFSSKVRHNRKEVLKKKKIKYNQGEGSSKERYRTI